jgi:hypothetical protein
MAMVKSGVMRLPSAPQLSALSRRLRMIDKKLPGSTGFSTIKIHSSDRPVK